MKTLLLPCLPVTEQTLTCDGAAADSKALSRVGGGGKGQSRRIISKKASMILLILSLAAILKQVK